MSIHIQLLGGFFIQIDQQVIRLGNASRIQALLAYLALQSPAPVLRANLAFQLWPDSSEKQAQTNLRKLLHQLRQTLPLGRISLFDEDARQIRLTEAPDVHVDLITFDAALKTASAYRSQCQTTPEMAALHQAIESYQGDLLPGCYDDWLLDARERIRQQFILSADRLVVLLEQRQQYREAIDAINRLLKADSLREDTYRHLIRLHSLRGDRAAALTSYHTCVEILSTRLGVEPDDATRQLYESLIRESGAATPSALHVSHPLIARRDEWAALADSWQKACRGQVRVHLLCGEAGIGKTRLAEDFVYGLARQGTETARAVCYENDQVNSFAPVIAWLKGRPLNHLASHRLSEVARLLPELLSTVDRAPAVITENWQRISFWDALSQALLGDGMPLILLLDDIQWCDRDTLDWLHYLIRTQPEEKVLLIATVREGELEAASPLSSFFSYLRLQGWLSETWLPRLSASETTELALSICGRDMSEELIYGQSEGVPLFIVEMARKTLDPVQGEPGSAEGPASKAQAVLTGRLERLTFSARLLAQAIAIFGREVSLQTLVALAGLPQPETMLALDELWQRRIVRETTGGRYYFSHVRLSEAALFNLSPVRQQWLHLQSAAALEATGDHGLAAGHFLAANEPLRAAQAFFAAAQNAIRLFALKEARSLMEQGLNLNSQPDFAMHEQYGDILRLMGLQRAANEAYGCALVACHSGDWRSQVRLHRQMMDCISRLDYDSARSAYQQGAADLLKAPAQNAAYWTEWLELHLGWFRANYWSANTSEMARLLVLLEAPLSQYGSAAQQIQFHHDRLQLHLVTHRYTATAEQLELARQNVEAARRLDSPFELAERLSSFGFIAFFANELTQSEQAYSDCLSIAETHGFLGIIERAYAYRSLVYRCQRQASLVTADLDALESVVTNTQAPTYRALALAQRAWLRYLMHDWKQARQFAEHAIYVWKEDNNLYPLQWPGRIVLLALAVAEGDGRSAQQHAHVLLLPRQQRLPHAVETALQTALAIGDSPSAWQKVIESAISAGYL